MLHRSIIARVTSFGSSRLPPFCAANRVRVTPETTGPAREIAAHDCPFAAPPAARMNVAFEMVDRDQRLVEGEGQRWHS